MKIRNDSPFYGITDEQIDEMLELATLEKLWDVAEWWVRESGREVDMEQVRRFLVRARQDRRLKDSQDAAEDMAELGEAGRGGKARDGVIEAARLRLLEEAMEKGDSATLLGLYKAANQEKALENQAEVERRKAAVAEENAKIGWKRLELKRAEAAFRLLPKVWAILTDATMEPLEKVVRAQECLARDGARLLPEEVAGKTVTVSAEAAEKVEVMK